MGEETRSWLSPAERPVWLLIAVFIIMAFAIFWMYGFSRLPFPV